MATKYLYIDDQAGDRTEAYKDEVVRHAPQPGLIIVLSTPKFFDTQIKELDELANSSFDGLILDLRLDQAPVPHDETERRLKVAYRATALAQEIRTRATEGKRDYPLILWSMDAKLKKSFVPDNTGHDLFDLKCVKEEIEEPFKAKRIALQMIALVQGYKLIAAQIHGKKPELDLLRCLGFDTRPPLLDGRIFNAFEGPIKRMPVHEFARFILRQILETPGPLIDDAWLAARLGIDLSQSTDFERLKDIFKPIAYKGAFEQGWPRWWAASLEEWWEKQPNCPGPLRKLKSVERVEFINKLTKIRGLTAAQPIDEGYSTAYWTLCQITGKPLDPRDGFALLDPHKKVWQERLYISKQSALRNEHIRNGRQLEPIERERLEQLKTLSSGSKSVNKTNSNTGVQ